MRSFTSLMLLAIAGLAAVPLHASTIVTDTVVFTYSTSAGTEQNNFSFIDGTIAPTNTTLNDTKQNVQGMFSLPVAVYPNWDQTGLATAGTFFKDSDTYVGLLLSGGPGGLGATLEGYTAGYLAANAVTTYAGGLPTSLALFLNPGTYQLQLPILKLGGDAGQISLESASFTITQTTSVIPDPVAVTPEPSSFALLGTGLLGIGGVLRRRVQAWA